MTYITKYLNIYRLDDEHSLLINTLTNAKDIIDNDTFSIINTLQHDSAKAVLVSKELLNQLKERGYIFDSEEKESELLATIHKINNQIKARTYLPNYIICPTMGCNLRCTYCFESNDQHNDLSLLDEGQLNIVFDRIRKTCAQIDNTQGQQSTVKKQYPRIILFGGEPLLPTNAKIIKRVFDFAAELNLQVYIITNGTNIGHYSEILEKNRERVFMQITMDGDRETHNKRRIKADGSGTFDQICKGIDEALKIGIPVSLRVNVDRDNLQNIFELQNVFQTHGWQDIPIFRAYLSPVICYELSELDNTLTETDILEYVYHKDLFGNENNAFSSIGPVTASVESFFKSKDDYSEVWKISFCGSAMGANFCFAPDGFIYPCLNCCGQKDRAIGTYNSDAIEIDQTRYGVWKTHDPFEKKKCRDCKYLLLCGGSCPADTKYDEEECEVRLTYDQVFELYVNRNKKSFLE